LCTFCFGAPPQAPRSFVAPFFLRPTGSEKIIGRRCAPILPDDRRSADGVFQGHVIGVRVVYFQNQRRAWWPNAECRMPNAECRMPNAEFRTNVVRDRLLAVRCSLFAESCSLKADGVRPTANSQQPNGITLIERQRRGPIPA
jgi:hypothetical protein